MMDFSPLSPNLYSCVADSSTEPEPSTCYWKDVWRRLYAMRKSWELCDIALYSDEGLMFKAHSIILAASSSIFSAQLVSNTETFMEKLSPTEHVLHGINADVLKVTLDFIYGMAPETIVNFKRLQKGADKLGIPAASSFCRQQLNELEQLAKGSGNIPSSSNETNKENQSLPDGHENNKGINECMSSSPSRAQDLLSQCPYLSKMSDDNNVSKTMVPLKKRFLLKVLSQLKEEESPARMSPINERTKYHSFSSSNSAAISQNSQSQRSETFKNDEVIRRLHELPENANRSKCLYAESNNKSMDSNFGLNEENGVDIQMQVDHNELQDLKNNSNSVESLKKGSNFKDKRLNVEKSNKTFTVPQGHTIVCKQQHNSCTANQISNNSDLTTKAHNSVERGTKQSRNPKNSIPSTKFRQHFHHQPDFSDLMDIPHPIPDLAFGDMGVQCPHLEKLVGQLDNYTGIPIDVMNDDNSSDDDDDDDDDPENVSTDAQSSVERAEEDKVTDDDGDKLKKQLRTNENIHNSSEYDNSEVSEEALIKDIQAFIQTKSIKPENVVKVSVQSSDTDPLSSNNSSPNISWGNTSQSNELPDLTPETIASTVANLIQKQAGNTGKTIAENAMNMVNNLENEGINKNATLHATSSNFETTPNMNIMQNNTAKQTLPGLLPISTAGMPSSSSSSVTVCSTDVKNRHSSNTNPMQNQPLESKLNSFQSIMTSSSCNTSGVQSYTSLDVYQKNNTQECASSQYHQQGESVTDDQTMRGNRCPFKTELLDLSMDSSITVPDIRSTHKVPVSKVPVSVDIQSSHSSVTSMSNNMTQHNQLSTNVSQGVNEHVSALKMPPSSSSSVDSVILRGVSIPSHAEDSVTSTSLPGIHNFNRTQCSSSLASFAQIISNSLSATQMTVDINQSRAGSVSYSNNNDGVDINSYSNENRSEIGMATLVSTHHNMDTFQEQDSPISATNQSVYCIEHSSENSNDACSNREWMDTSETSPQESSSQESSSPEDANYNNQTIFKMLKDRSYSNPDGKKIYRCIATGCEYNNRSMEYVQSHLYHRHGYGKPEISCTLCPRRYFSETQLRTHMKQTHDVSAKQRQHPCDICQGVFKTSQQLHMHQLKVHGKGKLFSCEDCAFKSPRKKDLQGHMISQHRKAPPGVRIYECQRCNYKCIDKNRFSEHDASHTQVKSFKCDFCKNYYATRRGLRNHLKYHSEDRPHVCNICSATFKVRAKLRDHKRLLHEQKGEKPYKCGYCDFRASVRGNVNQHIRNIHKGQPITVIDMMKEHRTHVKAYDYANLTGANIEEIKDASAAGYASVGKRSGNPAE